MSPRLFETHPRMLAHGLILAAALAGCGGGNDAQDEATGTATMCAQARPACTTQTTGQSCSQVCTPYWPPSCTTVCRPGTTTANCTSSYTNCSGATSTAAPSGSGTAATSVTVTIGEIGRIPKHGVNQAFSRAVTVQLTPETLPGGMTVTLRLATTTGAGNARLLDAAGQETAALAINRSQTVRIRGKEHSSVKDNVELTAWVGNTAVASRRFSVRTWPVGFARVGGCDGVNDADLHSYYRWHSESGNHDDLNGLHVGEFVHFPQQLIWLDRYCLPNPPYDDTPGVTPCKDNPSTWYAPLGTAGQNNPLTIWNEQIHDHLQMDRLSGTLAPHTYVASQYFFFRDPVLMAPQRRDPVWSDRSSYQLLSTTAYPITRTIHQRPDGRWEFRVEQHQCVETRLL